MGFLVLLLVTGVDAQITRTATFENYTAGQFFRPSFTDPLSGISFYDSTTPPGYGFAIDGSPNGAYFSGGNYLTAGGGPFNGLGAYFGFTADLPFAANHVNLEAEYQADSITNVVLKGFDSSGHVVAQESGQASMSNPFTLEIDSAQYNITTFQISVGGGAAGYDNISYTYLPEPAELGLLIVAGGVVTAQRNCSRRGSGKASSGLYSHFPCP
jgi:hypothetical protein